MARLPGFIGWLAVAACAAPAPSAPVDQAPPPGPGGLTLAVDGVMEPGATLTLSVSGARPGARLYVLWSTAVASPPTTCPAALGGLCLDLDAPAVLPAPGNPLRANASGAASLTLRVPSSTAIVPDGFVAWFQVAQVGATPATSAPVPRFNPFDTAGLATIEIEEQADVTPGASYAGTRDERYRSAYHGLDVCTIRWTAAATGLGGLPPCPGCTFAFRVSYGAPQEASVAGDCAQLLGLQVSSLAGFSEGIGHHPAYTIPGYGTYEVAMVSYGGGWTWLTPDVTWSGGQLDWAVAGYGFYRY